MNQSWKPFFLAVMLFGLMLAAMLLPVRDWLAAGILWIDTHQSLAWAIFILAYALTPVLLIPGTILTLAAGFAFGLPMGVPLVSVGSLLGAVNAFLVGRFFARGWVIQHLAKAPRFNALNDATRHRGFVIVLLTRLSPLIPFNVLNYVLGLTKVRLKDYCLASWIGMLPANIVYTYTGSVAKDIVAITSGNFERSTADYALFLMGLAFTIVLILFITRKATRTLKKRLEHCSTEPSET